MEIFLEYGRIKVVDRTKTYWFDRSDIVNFKTHFDKDYFLINVNKAGVPPTLRIYKGGVTNITHTTIQSLYAACVALADTSADMDISPSKRYVALVSQASTAAPTAIVMMNTVGTVTPEYVGVGTYKLSAPGLLTTNKTVPVNELPATDASGNTITMTLVDDDYFLITTKNSSDTLTDGILSNQYISFEVFN